MNTHEQVIRKLLPMATVVGAILASTSAWAVCPSARAQHVAIYDPIHQQMVMFGGSDGVNALSDVWKLSLPAGDALVWSPLTITGTPPPCSIEGTAVYDSRGGRMIYFGGRSANGAVTDNNVWALELGAGTGNWVQLSVPGTRPTPRTMHSAIYDPVRDKMVICGGDTPGAQVETWEFSFTGLSGGSWSQITSPGAPAARSDQPSVYDTEFNRMVVSGGGQQRNTMVLTLPACGDKVWSQPWVGYWNQVAGQSMVWDPVFNRMVAFGGGGGCYFADPNVIVMAPYQGDPTTFSYGAISCGGAPTPRTNHTAIYDAANQRMVLFGGQYTNGFLPCTPLYSNQTFTLPLVEWNLGYTNFTLVSGCGSDPGLTFEADSSEPTVATVSLRLVGGNPFAGSAQFAFVTPAPGHVDLNVFDLLGRHVATLADGEFEAGQHSAKWDGLARDGRRASSGVYFVRLRQGAEVREQRVILQPSAQ